MKNLPRPNKKIPCNSTRFFFEKINGKQFHPKYSGCDDFSVRLQIRKHKTTSWKKVAKILTKFYFWELFITEGMTSATDTKLVSTFRNKKKGNHKKCLLASSAYKKAYLEYRKTGKLCNFNWPINCKLRK